MSDPSSSAPPSGFWMGSDGRWYPPSAQPAPAYGQQPQQPFVSLQQQNGGQYPYGQYPTGQHPYGPQQQPYGQYPYSPYPYGGQPMAKAGNGLSIAGLICGLIAFLLLPIILGPAGLILGGIGKSKGESLSTLAMVVAGIGTVVGMLLGFAVARSNGFA